MWIERVTFLTGQGEVIRVILGLQAGGRDPALGLVRTNKPPTCTQKAKHTQKQSDTQQWLTLDLGLALSVWKILKTL